VFAISFPNQEALVTIYTSILGQHLSQGSFLGPVQKFVPNLVNGALALHAKITTTFLPTAIKFHYVFNLRDLSNIFQGVLFAGTDTVKTPMDLIRLWMHEHERVYRDKMVDQDDMDTFDKVQKEIVKKSFEDADENLLFAKPLIYCHFAGGIGDNKYVPNASTCSFV
jgi:dynein heavy chain